MKIVTVCMSKNEEILIESFIRYGFEFSDTIIIYNHCSTDGTVGILSSLKEEYDDRLIVIDCDDENKTVVRQAEVTNRLIRKAFEELNADMVLPLDTDEFPVVDPKCGKTVREYLEELDLNECYDLYWMPFAPSGAGVSASNVFVPSQFSISRRTHLTQWKKVIITRKRYYNENLWVCVGNHQLLNPKCEVQELKMLSPDLHYAHYSCLSKEHYIRKITNGWLAYYSSANWSEGMSLHYQNAYSRLLISECVEKEELEWFSLTGGGISGETREDIQKDIMVINPELLFPKIELKYTEREAKNKDNYLFLMETALGLADVIRGKYALVAEKDAMIAEKDAMIAEKDAMIAEKDAMIAEKDAMINGKEAIIQEKNDLLAVKDKEYLKLYTDYLEMNNSKSFKVGRIITYIPRKLRSFLK